MATPRKYRPSVFVHLQVRLEDFSKQQDPDAQSAARPFSAKLKSASKKVDLLQEKFLQAQAANSVDRAAIQDLDRQLRKARAAKAKLQDQKSVARAQKDGPGDEFSVDLYAVPIDMAVEMNSFRIADTLSATFQFIDVPLISDVIRAAVVEVWAGTITPEDFAAPDRWRLRRDRSTILFRGWVDTWDTSHDESDATVQISARSYESLLMDAKINPLAPVYRIPAGSEKITAYLDRVLSQFPATSGGDGKGQIRAVWYGADPAEEPVLDRRTLNRSLQSAASRNASQGGSRDETTVTAEAADTGGTPPEASLGPTPGGETRLPPRSAGGMAGTEMSVWDLFTQACELAGCIPVYDPSLPSNAAIRASGGSPADFILLRPAQTIYEDIDEGYKVKGGPIDGFSRRFNLPSGKEINSQIRFMVWGHNIKSFKTSRKLGRVKVLGVEIRSPNPDGPPGKRVLVARYPNTEVVNRIGAKGEGGTNEIFTKIVKGIRDPKMLQQIAVSTYHAISRQETSVLIETDDLASYIDPSTSLDHNDEAKDDLLKLRPGAPCRVAVAREVRTPGEGQTLVISPLSEVFERRDEVLFKLLQAQTDRFANRTFAAGTRVEDAQRRISRALANAKLTDLFYCRTINHKFTGDEGWSCSMELVNFITARNLPKVMDQTTREADDARKIVKGTPTRQEQGRVAIEQAKARLDKLRALAPRTV